MVSLLIQQDPSLERRKKLAEAMIQRGQRQGPVRHWSEGLSRVIDTGVGAYSAKKAAEEESERRKRSMDSLAQAISGDGMGAGGMGPPEPLMSRLAGVEGINPEAIAQIKLQQEMKPQPRDPVSDAIAIERGKLMAENELTSPKAFEGKGIEAQALNIILDKSIPENDPRKILAKQRLGRETALATPEGTLIQPGYNLSELDNGKNASGNVEGRFIPKPPTEGQAKTQGFYERMKSASSELDDLGDYDPGTLYETMRGVTNITATPERQRYNQASQEWVNAKLRRESGAAITDREGKREYRTYFYQVGDSPEVLSQKNRAKLIAEQAMLQGASPEYLRKLTEQHAREIEALEGEQGNTQSDEVSTDEERIQQLRRQLGV